MTRHRGPKWGGKEHHPAWHRHGHHPRHKKEHHPKWETKGARHHGPAAGRAPSQVGVKPRPTPVGARHHGHSGGHPAHTHSGHGGHKGKSAGHVKVANPYYTGSAHHGRGHRQKGPTVEQVEHLAVYAISSGHSSPRFYRNRTTTHTMPTPHHRTP